MHPAKRQGRGEDHNVARLQAVHGLLVGVEPHELAVLRHVDLIAELALDGPVAAVEAVLEGIGHRHQLDGDALDRHGVGGCAGATATAADQGQLDRIILPGMDRRDQRGCQGRGGGNATGVFQKVSAGNGTLARHLHR